MFARDNLHAIAGDIEAYKAGHDTHDRLLVRGKQVVIFLLVIDTKQGLMP
jgi:hypothetical protein